MRRLIQKDWFWWVGSVAFVGSLSFAIIRAIQIANSLFYKYTGLIRRTLLSGSLDEPIQVGIALGLSTALCSWWLIYRTSSRITIKSGAIAGALAVLLSHFIVFMLRDLYFLVFGLRDPVLLLDSEMVRLTLLVVPVISLMWFGWLTLPLGAFFGGLLGWLYKRSRPVPEMEKASVSG